MLHDTCHCFRSITTRTGLQKEIFSRKQFIDSNVLTFINDLHLIHAGNSQLRSLLGRTRHPINILGNGFVPFVSIQTYFPAWCKQSIKISSIQREGSPPVRITVTAGYFRDFGNNFSIDISTPSSCRVSQKEHFRLQPEKRIKTAGVPV